MFAARPLRAVPVTIALAAAMLAPAPAAAQTWSGTGGDSNWSTPGNWVGGVAPASANTTLVTFGATAPTVNPNADAPWTINRLDLVGASGFVLVGSPLTFDGAAPQLNAGPASHLILNPLVLASTLAVDVATDLRLAAGTSGAGGLTKSGAGRLAIVAPGFGAVHGGTTTVLEGTLSIDAGSVPGPIVNDGILELAPSGGGMVLAQAMSGTGTLRVVSGSASSGGPPFTHTGPTETTFGQLSGQFLGGGALSNEGALTTGDSVFGSITGAGNLVTNGTAITVGGDGTSTTYTGSILGVGGLTKVGAGRLTLVNGVGFYGGTTTVSGGTLRLGDGATAPAVISGAMVIDAALEIHATGPGFGTTLFQGTSGTGSLTVLGGGVTSAGPDLAHAGGTIVQAGGQLAGSLTGGGPLTIDTGGQVDSVSVVAASLSGGGAFTFGSIVVGSDNSTTAFTGPMIGGVLTKVGSGRLTLAGATVHSGATLIDAGTLRFGDGVSAPAVIAGAIVDNGALEFHATTGTMLGGGVSGSGSLTVLGGPVASAGPLFNHSGATIVNAGGSLAGTFGGLGPLAIAAGGQVDAGDSSGFSTLAGAGLLNVNGPVGSHVGITNASSTFAGSVGGPSMLTKLGTGTLTLAGALMNTGGVAAVAGTLVVTGAVAGPVTVSAGATLGGTGTIGGPVTINAGGTLSPGLSPGILNTGNLSLGGATAIEIQGPALGTQYDNINVTGTVTIAGGTLSLSGAYVPALGDVFTIVSNDGADAVTGTFAGLPEGATVVFNGVTLRISYAGGTGNDITLSAPLPVTATWNGAAANDNWSTGANWIGGASPASGNTTLVTFPAASARFGPVVDVAWTINRMDVTSATAYAMTGSAIMFAGAAPQLNASGGAHVLANAITLSAALAVNNASTLTLSGAVGGPSGLVKSGAGRLALSGASTFTGGTTVNAGTLLVNGTIPGPVVVNGGATLGGTGTVSGPVTINAGGTFAPGLSPGITNTGNLVLAGIFLVEIEGTTLGTQYDNTNVTGTVNVTGGTLTLAGAHVPAAGSTYTLITNDGADAVVGTFVGLAEGATVNFNGVPMRISYVGGTGNDVVLTALAAGAGVVAIPTLSEWGLLILALLMGGAGMAATTRPPSAISPARVKETPLETEE